jgi:hypothetical protein
MKPCFFGERAIVMAHGLFIEDEASLHAMFARAMSIGAFAVAERIAFQINEPGKLYYGMAAYRAPMVTLTIVDVDGVPKLGGSTLGAEPWVKPSVRPLVAGSAEQPTFKPEHEA